MLKYIEMIKLPGGMYNPFPDMIVLLSSCDIWLNCQTLNMTMNQIPNEIGSEQHNTLVTAAGATVLLEYLFGERHSEIPLDNTEARVVPLGTSKADSLI